MVFATRTVLFLVCLIRAALDWSMSTPASTVDSTPSFEVSCVPQLILVGQVYFMSKMVCFSA